jgi:hypothetical protein
MRVLADGGGAVKMLEWDGRRWAEPSDDRSNIAQLVPTKPDADIAAELKAKIAEALKPVCALIDEAAAAGFLVNWTNIHPNAFGKREVIDLHLVKRF